MIEKFLIRLKNKQESYVIRGKGLLYNIDLALTSLGDEKHIKIKCEGTVRLGPLKGTGAVLSHYQDNSGVIQLEKHKIAFGSLKFFEDYHRRDKDLFYSKNNQEPTLVDEGELKALDPLPFILNLMNPGLEKNVHFSGELLFGGKKKPFQFLKEDKTFNLHLEGKLLFRGHFEEGVALLEIPKVRAKLKIQES